MTTTTMTAEERLGKLGIHLPDAPTPFGAYVPAVHTGKLLFLSGMLATSGHTATAVGIVGKDLDVNAGRLAAYTAALNVLALAKKQLSSLDRVSRVVRSGNWWRRSKHFMRPATLPVKSPPSSIEKGSVPSSLWISSTTAWSTTFSENTSSAAQKGPADRCVRHSNGRNGWSGTWPRS